MVLAPLRLIGPYYAAGLVQLLTVRNVIRLGNRLGLAPLRVVLVLFSPPVFWHIIMGQIDGLLLGAYLAPPLVAAFAGIAKPQSMIGAWIGAARRRPVGVVLVSAALVGSAWLVWGWPFAVSGVEIMGIGTVNRWIWSPWPWGLALAPLILRPELRSRLLASPFLFPYAGVHSFIGPMLAAASLRWVWFVPIWGLTWLRWAWMLEFF